MDELQKQKQKQEEILLHKQTQVSDPIMQEEHKRMEEQQSAKRQFKEPKIRSLDEIDPPPEPIPYEPVKKGKKQVGALKKEEISGTYSDQQRLGHRDAILSNAVMDLKEKSFAKESRSIFQDVKTFAKMNATARNDGAVEKERVLLMRIQEKLKSQMEHFGNLEKKGELSDLDKKEMNTLKIYQNYFQTTTSGYLQVPGQESATEKLEDRTNTQVVGIRKKWVKENGKQVQKEVPIEMRSAVGEPLFVHEPSLLDIQQGGLGDCYLLAALSSMVHASPQQIKECMKDNGKTVTVRFFDTVSVPNADPTQPAAEQIIKRYVTVNKEVPKSDEYASGCLWVQMIERAYAASGLHKNRETGQQFREGDQWTPQYQDLSGGQSGEFLFTMTGRKQKAIEIFKEANQFSYYKVYDAMQSTASSAVRKQRRTEGNSDVGISVSTADMICHILGYAVPTDADQLFKMQEIYATFMEALSQAKDDYWMQGTEKKTNKKVTYRTGMPTLEEFKEFLDKMPMTIQLVDGDMQQDQVKRANAKAIQTIKDKFYQYLCTMETPLMQHKAFSGLYTAGAVKQYEAIEQAVDQGQIVAGNTYKFVPENVVGADGKNAEHVRDGLAEGHAYSILGVKTIGENRFVKLRNPWGTGTRAYFEEVKTRQRSRERKDENTEGIFLMELNEFMNTFSKVTMN